MRNEEWQIEEELILKERKLYILKNEKLRVEIIQLYYDMLVVGYRER